MRLEQGLKLKIREPFVVEAGRELRADHLGISAEDLAQRVEDQLVHLISECIGSEDAQPFGVDAALGRALTQRAESVALGLNDSLSGFGRVHRGRCGRPS